MENSALSQQDEMALKAYAEALGMIYISTPFSRSAADFLNEIDVPAFKIGSGECDHLPLIRHIAQFGKPIIMSTGMQSIETIRASVDILEKSGVPYALLECTNLYPSPPEIVSLQGVRDLQERLSQSRCRLFRPLDRPRDGPGVGGTGCVHTGAAFYRSQISDRTGYSLLDGSVRTQTSDRQIARNPHRITQPEKAHNRRGGCLSFRSQFSRG